MKRKLFFRAPNKKCRRDDEIRNSPFVNCCSNNLAKKHQWILSPMGESGMKSMFHSPKVLPFCNTY